MKKKFAGKFLMGVVVVALFVGGFCSFAVLNIPPFKSLGYDDVGRLELGMREADVSLAFGRKPDCQGEGNEAFKEMLYDIGVGPGLPSSASACRYNVFLRNEDGIYKVSTICFGREISQYLPIRDTAMKYEWPRNIWSDVYRVPNTEKMVLDDLGSPSYTSINANATGKYISFDRYNAAFYIVAGHVVQACISNELPLRVKDEYKTH